MRRPILVAVARLAASLAVAVMVSWVEPAHAQGAREAEAVDLVYEAADALDRAQAELDAGRQNEAERWISQAERQLEDARAIAPGLPRLGFESARLHRLDGAHELAEEKLVASMRSELPFGEHVRSVELLNAIRADLGKPSVGAEWRTTQTLRDAGIATLAGGLVASVVGFAIGFGTFAEEAYTGVTDQGIGGNRFGWALSAVGGGVALAGGGMTLAGQVKLVGLRSILPGPWRLAAGPGLGAVPIAQAPAPQIGAALLITWGAPRPRAR